MSQAGSSLPQRPDGWPQIPELFVPRQGETHTPDRSEVGTTHTPDFSQQGIGPSQGTTTTPAFVPWSECALHGNTVTPVSGHGFDLGGVA